MDRTAFNKRIGGHIAAARKHLCLSQGELGRRLGISDSLVSRHENGNRELTVYDLERYCCALNICVYTVFVTLKTPE